MRHTFLIALEFFIDELMPPTVLQLFLYFENLAEIPLHKILLVFSVKYPLLIL